MFVSTAFAQNTLTMPVDNLGGVENTPEISMEKMADGTYADYNSDIVDYNSMNTPTDDFWDMMLNSIGAGFGMIFILVIYIAFPIILYCIGSFSLARLDMHYNKVKSSGISWVPFARYFHIIKNATWSSKKAFSLTILPWILIIVGIVWLVIATIISNTAESSTPVSWFVPVMIILGSISLIGFLSVIIMNFWCAFIIKNYVKGDTTTALGLSTYTSVVLWYIALQRSTGKTDIIGKIGFICLGLVALMYIVMIGFFIYAGVTEGFNTMNSTNTYGDISWTIGGDL